ncbi:MAG: hypothetical protein OIN86_10190 [Candidatus Methanoperedens sp.]|nr:hypothetical protein [Candidatus Methanoperedens sp.]CAG0970876.1 hypothetical protein METP1_01234 [Methanosarcinales archaeon]
MISKKDLKGYGKATMEELFEYIIESRENGQFEQTRSIISHLSESQHIESIKWLRDNGQEISDIFLGD